MDEKIQNILSKCDHTLLKPDTTWNQIYDLCIDAIKYKTASVCIPQCYVRKVKNAFPHLNVCTVIGFPNGNCTTEVKVFEASEAIANGADEIDMVINIGKVKESDYYYVLSEVRRVKAACCDHILKVIIETCLLTNDEIIGLCDTVAKGGADYIKTSTGFSSGGATFETVKLMKEHVPSGLKIKAAGGISSLEDAENFIALGADRLGTSRVVKCVKQMEKEAKSENTNKHEE